MTRWILTTAGALLVSGSVLASPAVADPHFYVGSHHHGYGWDDDDYRWGHHYWRGRHLEGGFVRPSWWANDYRDGYYWVPRTGYYGGPVYRRGYYGSPVDRRGYYRATGHWRHWR